MSRHQRLSKVKPSRRGQDLDPVSRRDPIRCVEPIFIGEAVTKNADPLDDLRPNERMRQVRTKFLGTARRPSPPRDPRVRRAFSLARERGWRSLDREGIDPMTAPDSLAEPISEDHQGRGSEKGRDLFLRDHCCPILGMRPIPRSS